MQAAVGFQKQFRYDRLRGWKPTDKWHSECISYKIAHLTANRSFFLHLLFGSENKIFRGFFCLECCAYLHRSLIYTFLLHGYRFLQHFTQFLNQIHVVHFWMRFELSVSLNSIFGRQDTDLWTTQKVSTKKCPWINQNTAFNQEPHAKSTAKSIEWN